MIFDVCSVTQVSLTSVKWGIWDVFVGGRGVGGINGFVFVLWVFVIENLNKGNINMNMFASDVLKGCDFALQWK